jgi:hypothetical protein
MACACRPCRCRFRARVNLSDICSIQGNKACANTLSITAITQPKVQPHHETTFIDRICSLHFCAHSNAVCVGNADCPPECTYGRWQLNHPSPWLGPSRWRSRLGPSRWPRSSLWMGSRSSLWMGSRPPLWMRPSSPLVKTSLGDYSERSRLSLAAFSFEPNAKAAKVSLDGSFRCVAFAWRFAAPSGARTP